MRIRSPLAPGYDFWGRTGLYEPLVASALGRSGAELRHRAVAVLELRPGESVVDIATGTGLMLPMLAGAVGPAGRVVGVDRSATMLERSRGRAALVGADLVEADAEELPFRDGEFDAAVSAFGMTAVTDVDRALDEMIRVVRPGGRFAIAEIHAVNWPTPHAFNRTVTRVLRPFNSWHHERDIAALVAARGLAPAAVPTGRDALTLTVTRRSEGPLRDDAVRSRDAPSAR